MNSFSSQVLKVQKSSVSDRINIKINILTEYVRKEQECLNLVNTRFNNPRSFDLISEDNLRAHLRLKAMIIYDIADYKKRIEEFKSQLK